MIRIVVTLAMLLAFAREASSQDASTPAAPRLRELVMVTNEIVRIGDLVDNAGASANIPVFRAPDLGQTGSVQLARVTDALRPHVTSGLDTGGLGEVVVTRLSRAITPKDIETRITRAISGQYGFGDAGNLAITPDRELRTLHVEAAATGDLLIARINVEPRSGRFDISLELPGSAVARRLPLRFTGTVTETVEAVTLTRALARGDTVKASDVVIERRPKAEVMGDGIAPDNVIGFATKRPLRAGQALRTADLMRPEVVQRNEGVRIVYEVPGILITMRGKALETGAVGDLINVMNIQSNRTVQATVTGPGRVSIAATMPIVAAAVASESEPDNTVRRRAE